MTVLGFGRPTTAPSFQAACTTFTAIEGNGASTPASTVGTAKQKTETKRQPTLPEMLASAIAKNADKQGWARVSAVANHMRQHHGQTSKDHGKSTWTKSSRHCPATSSATKAPPASPCA